MIQRVLGALCFGLFAAPMARAQLDTLNLSLNSGAKKEVTAALVSDVTAIQPGKPFRIGVKFDVPKGYYTYYKSAGSIGLGTKIAFKVPDGFQIGEPQFPAPTVKYFDIEGKAGANYIYKSATVVFATVTPPAGLAAGLKPTFSATARYQYCEEEGSCILAPPPKLELSLPVAADPASVKASPDAMAFASAALKLPKAEGKYISVQARLTTDALRSGETTKLAVVVDIKPGFKIQMNQPTIEGLISTDVVLDDAPGIERLGVPQYPKPLPANDPLQGFENALEYRGQVVIEVPIKGKESLTGDPVVFTGLVQAQACDKSQCFSPEWVAFRATVPVGDGAAPVAAQPPGPVAPAPPEAIPTSAEPAGSLNGSSSLGVLDDIALSDDGNLRHYLLLAFLGGLILNVMPCVLPVIAIKVIGFVQQAGESKERIFLLNVAYSFGVVAVFWALAALAVFAGFGWGGLFQSPKFNLAMAGIVFSMGLSLLGVFEIPVPGFVASSSPGHKEGPLGAFLTGVLATLLATPCSGPFLGVTLGWSVRQPASVTFAVWTVMGLGMASPYLIFGIFPGLIRLLPKPGPWMVAFKELAGMVLMGTVVFIITFLDQTSTVPVLIMLVGLALAFWMIGNLYDFNSSPQTKAAVRVLAAGVAIGFGVFAFTIVEGWMVSREQFRLAKLQDEWRRKHKVVVERGAAEQNGHELPWEPFSVARLKELVEQKKTVLIDFTADWCLTCKSNESLALNTRETRQLVDELDAVTLYADFTDGSEEIAQVLKKFNSISVPLTVIFPAKDSRRPIVLRDAYFKSTLLERLREAGPSLGPRQASRPRDEKK